MRRRKESGWRERESESEEDREKEGEREGSKENERDRDRSYPAEVWLPTVTRAPPLPPTSPSPLPPGPPALSVPLLWPYLHLILT